MLPKGSLFMRFALDDERSGTVGMEAPAGRDQRRGTVVEDQRGALPGLRCGRGCGAGEHQGIVPGSGGPDAAGGGRGDLTRLGSISKPRFRNPGAGANANRYDLNGLIGTRVPVDGGMLAMEARNRPRG